MNRAEASDAAGRPRLDAIDFLKAAAIFAVVTQHAGFLLSDPRLTEWDHWLTATWVWFHVPTFLFVSGFLYCRAEGVSLAVIGARLSRLLLPYAVASVAVQALGVIPTRNVAEALWRTATGSAIGIYYFVPILAVCIILVWPLSRAGRPGAWALLALAVVYTVGCALQPQWALPLTPFWKARIPTETFLAGYFLTGWTAALYGQRFTAWLVRHRWPLLTAAACGVALWFAVLEGRLPREWVPVTRAIYTLSCVGWILTVTRGQHAGRLVRWLSDASLTIFLYHAAFQFTTVGWVDGVSPPLRIAFQVAVGLAGPALLLLAAHRLLGPQRSRTWFGA